MSDRPMPPAMQHVTSDPEHIRAAVGHLGAAILLATAERGEHARALGHLADLARRALVTKEMSWGEFVRQLDTPTGKHLMDRVQVLAAEAEVFRILKGAAFLEATLRLRDGAQEFTHHFEWDADADEPLATVLVDEVMNAKPPHQKQGAP